MSKTSMVCDVSDSLTTSTSSLTWISWFCSLSGHEYFCQVSEDFIEDDFNLTGLSSLVPFYKDALEMVLDVEPDEEALRVPDVSIIESSAELLYGLIHQRFILTKQGLHQMFLKYDSAQFGFCPRVYCSQTRLIPCGRSDLPGVDTVKLFCPCCLDMYVPSSSRYLGIDGAFFGTTFASMLYDTYRLNEPATKHQVYVPKIYGFRISERARSGPRMKWMRMRPEDPAELETATPAPAVAATAPDAPAAPAQSSLFDDENEEPADAKQEEEEEE